MGGRDVRRGPYCMRPPMPKKKTPDEKPADQFKRFKKAAEEQGVSLKEAEDAFKRLAGRAHKK